MKKLSASVTGISKSSPGSRKSVTRLSNAGFTMLDVLIAIAIVSIILGVGIPGFNAVMERKQIVALAEQLAGHVMLVRSEAIARSSPTYLRIAAGTSWVYGLSTNDDCDLSATAPAANNACILVVEDGDANSDPGDGSVDVDDLVLHRFEVAEHPNMTIAISNFTGAPSKIVFDSVRGLSDSGDFTISSTPNNYQLRVKVGLLGDVRICSPTGDLGYSPVNC